MPGTASIRKLNEFVYLQPRTVQEITLSIFVYGISYTCIMRIVYYSRLSYTKMAESCKQVIHTFIYTYDAYI